MIFTPALLDQCISCGFCLPACPTYALTADEASSPRGRINLMRAVQDGTLPLVDPTVMEQSSFCLGCRACEVVCPAGVRYGELLEQWRDAAWRGRRRPLIARAVMLAARRSFAIRLLGRLRGAPPRRRDWAAARRRTRDAASSPAVGEARDSVILSTAASETAPTETTVSKITAATAATRDATGSAPSGAGQGQSGSHPDSLLLGCFERLLFPQVSRDALRLCPSLQAPADQGCCGALHAHNGDLAAGRAMARRLGERLPGRIVTTSGGCAAHLAAVLGRERVIEISEYLTARSQELETVLRSDRSITVTLQDSCHLRNGLGVWREPRALLERVARYVELPNAAGCCGSAGTYSLLRPKDSARILAPKLDALEAAGVDVVIAVNPGCLRQLQQGLRARRSRVRAMHLVEFLATVLPSAATRGQEQR